MDWDESTDPLRVTREKKQKRTEREIGLQEAKLLVWPRKNNGWNETHKKKKNKKKEKNSRGKKKDRQSRNSFLAAGVVHEMTSVPSSWIGWSPLLSRRRGMYCRRVPSRLPSSSSSSSSSSSTLLLLLHFPLASPSSTGKHQGRWPYKVLLERQHNTSENSPKGESGVIVLPALCCCCSLFLPLRVFCLFACVHMFSTFLLRQKQFASAQVEGGNTQRRTIEKEETFLAPKKSRMNGWRKEKGKQVERDKIRGLKAKVRVF